MRECDRMVLTLHCFIDGHLQRGLLIEGRIRTSQTKEKEVSPTYACGSHSITLSNTQGCSLLLPLSLSRVTLFPSLSLWDNPPPSLSTLFILWFFFSSSRQWYAQ
jgi:hypothetical protein